MIVGNPIFVNSGSGSGEASLIVKTITENGNYYAQNDGADGYSEVAVTVPGPLLQEKTVTHNGWVFPDDGYDGLARVMIMVNQPSDVYALMIVVYSKGLICSVSNGTITYYAKDTSGRAVFQIPSPGTWTVYLYDQDSVVSIVPVDVITDGESYKVKAAIVTWIQNEIQDLELVHVPNGVNMKWLKVTGSGIQNLNGAIIDPNGKKVILNEKNGYKFQHGTCNTSARLPAVISSGTGRGSYQNNTTLINKSWTATASYPYIYFGISNSDGVTSPYVDLTIELVDP